MSSCLVCLALGIAGRTCTLLTHPPAATLSSADKGEKNKTGKNSCGFGELSDKW